jgi:hypothetical protein
MPWVKIDDSFTDHAKVEALSDRAFRLHVAGLCFCARMLTDGLIPEDRVKRLLPSVTKAMVNELVGGGIWLVVDGGYEVYGFLEYNRSKEKVLNDRAAAAERKAKFLAKKAEAEAKKNGVPNTVPNSAENGAQSRPDPTRPVGHRVGVSGAQAHESTPSPSAGVDEEGQAHVVVPEVLEGIRSIRSGFRSERVAQLRNGRSA